MTPQHTHAGAHRGVRGRHVPSGHVRPQARARACRGGASQHLLIVVLCTIVRCPSGQVSLSGKTGERAPLLLVMFFIRHAAWLLIGGRAEKGRGSWAALAPNLRARHSFEQQHSRSRTPGTDAGRTFLFCTLFASFPSSSSPSCQLLPGGQSGSTLEFFRAPPPAAPRPGGALLALPRCAGAALNTCEGSFTSFLPHWSAVRSLNRPVIPPAAFTQQPPSNGGRSGLAHPSPFFFFVFFCLLVAKASLVSGVRPQGAALSLLLPMAAHPRRASILLLESRDSLTPR